MVAEFPRTLSMLRQEKGISQRSAAASLQVSQALLSHYENGAREPGFDFLVRAAEFYGVSTDYLLGRTKVRCLDETEENETLTLNSNADIGIFSRTCARLIANSTAVLFDILGKSKRKFLVETVSQYLCLALYKAFRYLSLAHPNENHTEFTVSHHAFPELCDLEMKKLELGLKLDILAADKKTLLPPIGKNTLAEAYPQFSQSMLMLLQISEQTLSKK